MPGPPRWRTHLLVNHTLASQKLVPNILDVRATTILNFVKKVATASPEIVFGDGIEGGTTDTPASRAFNRKIAGEGMVLLKNEGGVLPIVSKPQKIAVIGPNARSCVISGGGSAFLKASYIVSPWAGILAAAPKGSEVKYAVGCYG